MFIDAAAQFPRSPDDLLDARLAARLDRLDLLSRRVLAGKMPGERRSKRRGRSVEFDDFRPYAAGDDPRHIDWNVYARLDRLVVKLFREDEDLALTLVVDVSPSMLAGDGSTRPDAAASRAEGDPRDPGPGSGPGPTPSKRLYALRAAMALGYIALVNQNRLHAWTFGGPAGLRRLGGLRGRRSVERLAAFLVAEGGAGGAGLSAGAPDAGEAASGGPGSFAAAMGRIASHPQSRGVLVLLSDLLFEEPLEPGLSRLVAAGTGAPALDACVLQVLTPGELDPAREVGRGLAGDLRLLDAEGARDVEITAAGPLIAAYRRRLEAMLERTRRACRTRGIEHYVVPTDRPVDDLIVRGLRKRRLVG